jgi:hypothetical protein
MKRISCFPVALVALLALLLWLTSPLPAAATILITEGTFSVGGVINGGFGSFTGDTRGFSMDAGGTYSSGYCSLCVGSVHPGDPLWLKAGWSGDDLDGSFTIDGASYTMGGAFGFSLYTTGSGELHFDGTTTAPPMTPEGTDTVTAPFSFTGIVHWLPPGVPLSEAYSPEYTETLAGAGLVTFPLVENTFLSIPTWDVRGGVYVFQTPEPGTLLLLGSGLAGLGGLVWRRHRRR